MVGCVSVESGAALNENPDFLPRNVGKASRLTLGGRGPPGEQAGTACLPFFPAWQPPLDVDNNFWDRERRTTTRRRTIEEIRCLPADS
jgi:hypothetical protein